MTTIPLSGGAHRASQRDLRNPLCLANHKPKLQRHRLASRRRQTIAARWTMFGLQDWQLGHTCWMNHASDSPNVTNRQKTCERSTKPRQGSVL